MFIKKHQFSGLFSLNFAVWRNGKHHVVLLPSCTRLDVFNFLERFSSFFKADTVPSAQHGRRCAVSLAAPLPTQCAHAPAMVFTRHIFSMRLPCTLTLQLQVGIFQTPLSIPFCFQIHHGPSPSNWSPRFSRCIFFPRCTEGSSGR